MLNHNINKSISANSGEMAASSALSKKDRCAQRKRYVLALNRLRVFVVSLVLIVLLLTPSVVLQPSQASARHSGATTTKDSTATGTVQQTPADQDLANLMILEFPLPTAASGPYGITAGSDGNMWITEVDANKIARMTPDGISFTEFPIPTAGSRPSGITAGPDGNVWFAESMGNKIGRVTVSPGSVAPGPVGTITEFALPFAGSVPFQLTAGPDGNVWFTLFSASNVGRITPSGSVTQFEIPTVNCGPSGITTGPDGNIWFTEYSSNKIGRITPSGAFSEFPIPTPNSAPFGIAPGINDDLWFTEQVASKVGRITVTGTISEFSAPEPNAGPSGIANRASGASANSAFSAGDSSTLGLRDIGATSADYQNRHDVKPAVFLADVFKWVAILADKNKVAEPKPQPGRKDRSASAVDNADAPVINTIPIPTPNSGTFIVTSGPGGAYFAESRANKIGKALPVITISPGSTSIAPGTSANLAINVRAGVPGPVSLAAFLSPQDSAISTSISPNPVSPGNSATLTISTGANTPPGDYGLTLTGASSEGVRTVTGSVTVGGYDFSLGLDQPTVTALAGTKARVTININRTGGFVGNVTIMPPGPADGIKPKPADPITTTDTTATFKLKIGGGVPPGRYDRVFIGKDETGRTRTAMVALVVQ